MRFTHLIDHHAEGYARTGEPDQPPLDVALLTDATGTTVIATWKPKERQGKLAAFDVVGADGWVIGPREWVPFLDGLSQVKRAARTASGRGYMMPAYIRAATENVEGLSEDHGSTGYHLYLLRRSVREEA